MDNTKKRCYELATSIQKKQPWNYFEDSDFIYIHLPDGKDLYIDVLGANKQIYGVSFFEGEEGLFDLLTMANNAADSPRKTIYTAADINNFTLYFEPVHKIYNPVFLDCIEPEYIKQKGSVPYFIHYDRGFVPDKPEKKDFKKLSVYLKIFDLLLEKIKEEGFTQHENEIISVYVDEDYEKDGTDSLSITFLPRPYMSTRYLGIPFDNKRVNKIKKKKQRDGILILDGFYLEPQYFEDVADKPFFPYFAILLSDDGSVLDNRLIIPNMDRIDCFQDMLLKGLEANGRYEAVAIRREEIAGSIGPILNELGMEMCSIDWNIMEEVFDDLEKTFSQFDDNEQN